MSRDVIADRLKQRVWILASCAGLTALALHQDPGYIGPDTKIDLTVDPIGFLARSVQLWDPAGHFGQLQNQHYGYLWPMGPFHVLGELMRLPDWVTQRLWWALLLCVAFLGVYRLAGKLNIGNDISRVMAGLSFALSVRILSELGAFSVEAWPSAIAPWVLVPLAGLPVGASLRRPVALSALAVACAGGVNATAVFAVVPLAVLWLLSLESTKRRLTALAGWGLAVALATFWWIGPLLLLGGYSPPFLDFIETAEVTTQVTDVQTTLRGATQWLAYLGDSFGPVWPAGHRLATEPLLIAASTAVAAFGMAGLARRGMPHRRFLITGLLLGVAMVGFGHLALVGGAFQDWQRTLLDGAGAPLRNVHKFDVLIRLPLALGLAHFAGIFISAARQRTSDRTTLRAIAASVAVATSIAVVATPAFASGLVARDKYSGIPAYWHEASAWLGKNLGDNRVLIVPGARFGNYYWGSTGDEVIQALTDERWAVRSAIPLAPPATIRFLDSVESALSTGAGSPGLADVLARAGIRYVLVRSDADYVKADATNPVVVRQALSRSPGLASVVSFGPKMGEAAPNQFLDKGLAGPVPALEVFEVQRPVLPVVVSDMSATSSLTGGPESLLDLASAGMLPPGPVVLSGDIPSGFNAGNAIVTDGLRRRELSFGIGRDAASATLSATELADSTAPAADYLPAWARDWLTVAGYHGISGVVASSSWGDLPRLDGARPEHHPYAALDGDLQTSWRIPPSVPAIGQWLEIRFATPQVISRVELTFDPGATNVPTKLTVDTGGAKAEYSGFAGSAKIELPDAFASTRIRITIHEVLPRGPGEWTGSAGLSEVTIPGIDVSRFLAVPAPKGIQAIGDILFTAAPRTPACFFSGTRLTCDPSLARGSEDGTVISRRFTIAGGGEFTPVVRAQPKPGPALDRLLAISEFHETHASSSAVFEPSGSPAAAMDANANTVWWPAASDKQPWLRLSWLGPRVIHGISVVTPPGVAASRPWHVQVIGDGGVRTGFLDEAGVLKFDPPMRTDEVTVSFLTNAEFHNHNPYTRQAELLPVAVGELSVLGETRIPGPPDEQLDLPCGSGPELRAGGQTWQTRLTATRRDLTELRTVPAVPCGDNAGRLVTLGPGVQELTVTGTALSLPVQLGLRAGAKTADSPGQVRVDSWQNGERRLILPPSAVTRILSVRENSNNGWKAAAGEKALAPVVVDGWQQGWIVPAGVSGAVVLTFAPEKTFRMALFAGGGALLLVVLAAWLPGSRRPSHIPGRHRFRREGLYVFGGVALFVVGGWAGVLIAISTVLAFALTRYVSRTMSKSDRLQLHRAARWVWLMPPVVFLVGGLLAEGPSYGYYEVWPQLGGLAAVITLWLSSYWPRRSGPRPAPLNSWALNEIPAQGGKGQPTGHGQGEHAGETAAEMRAVQLGDQIQEERVP